MNVERIKNDDALTLVIGGRLDTLTSPELEEIINTELDGVTDLTLDLAGLDYISSAGLRVLLRAQKKMAAAGTMKLVSVSPIIMEIFEITGFSEILTIE